jgi:predicted metal-dependent phosphoesterase TrpH
MGFDVQLHEVEALGRYMAGRPHFARVMVQKGYVSNVREAFDRYLDESAPGYVDREEPSIEEGIRKIREGGGVSSLAHPVRLSKRHTGEEERLIANFCDAGLQAIEALHSDHNAEDVSRYFAIARKYGLRLTGGSDFHGENKPAVVLGQLRVPSRYLADLFG